MKPNRSSSWLIASVVSACGILLLGPALVMAGSPDEPANYQFSCTITQIKTSISGDTSLTDDIGLRDDNNRLTAISGPFTFFTIARLKIGDLHYRLGEGGEIWNDRIRPPKDSQVEVLMRPSVLCQTGRPTEVMVGEERAFQFMRRLDDGRFELDAQELSVGITFQQTITGQHDGRVLIDPFVIQIASIQGREPLEGVELNVGKPILDVDRAELTLSLELGRTYGILWKTEHNDMVLITIQVTVHDPHPGSVTTPVSYK